MTVIFVGEKIVSMSVIFLNKLLELTNYASNANLLVTSYFQTQFLFLKLLMTFIVNNHNPDNSS